MSAGTFVRSKYLADYGAGDQIHPIRVQPETISASGNAEDNDPPAGDITNPISAKSSLGKRARGLSPRSITIQFPATGQPSGYKAGGITRIPALTPVFFDAQSVGANITYLGVTCVVVSKSVEQAD